MPRVNRRRSLTPCTELTWFWPQRPSPTMAASSISRRSVYAIRPSLWLDAGILDDFRETYRFAFDEARKLLRRARYGFNAGRRQPFFHVGRRQCFAQLCIQTHDDFARRCGGRQDAIPDG